MSEQRKRAALFDIVGNYDEALKGGLHEAGILHRLFVMILMKSRIDHVKLAELLVLYSRDMQDKLPQGTDKNSAKGNLVKELGKKSMSWKVFLKGLRFLRVVKFKITLTAYFYNREPVMVEIKSRIARGPCVGDTGSNDHEQPTLRSYPGNIPEQHQGPTAQALTRQLDEALRKNGQDSNGGF